MRVAVANLGSFAKGDTITDIVTVTSAYEEIAACDELSESDIMLSYYWGIREHGTTLTSSSKNLDKWLRDFKDQPVAVYKIEYANCKYSIKLYLSVDDGDVMFGDN